MLNFSFTEKRASLRFRVCLPLNYSQQGTESVVSVRSLDISSRGLRIETETNFPKGTLLNICLKMVDTGEEVIRVCKVVWSEFSYAFKDKMMHVTGVVLIDSEIKPIPIVLRTIKSQNKY